MASLPKIDGWFGKAIVAVLLFVQAALLVDTARSVSETFDEPMYLLASRSYWKTGDFSFNREHPPLSKLLIGAPLAWRGMELPADYHNDGATQLRFVYELNPDPAWTVVLGRLPMVLLGLLLSFYVYLYGRLLGGERVGLVSLAAVVFMPPLLGNTPLAALDLGASAFAFISLYHLARMRMEPTAGRTLFAGIAFGLAQLTKFSNLLLVPVFGVIAVVDVVRQRSLKPLLRLAAVFSVGFSVMFLCYGCEMRTVQSVKDHPRYGGSSTPGELFDWPILQKISGAFGDAPVPMLTYMKGLDYLKSQAGDQGHASYYRGETRWKFMLKEGESMEGWPAFYATSMAVKTPAGLLALLVMGILLFFAAPTRPRGTLPLILFPALLFGYFSTAPSQLGLRYILPVLPPCAVLIGLLVAIDPARRRRWIAVAGSVALIVLPLALAFEFRAERSASSGMSTVFLAVTVAGSLLAGVALLSLCLWKTQDQVVRKMWPRFVVALLIAGGLEAVSRHPDHLMFYNAYAGGPAQGWKVVAVGDDWGQGASQLAALQQERGWDELLYDYYGTGIPEIYGLRYRPYGGEPTAGIVAVHVLHLTRERYRGLGTYDWFDDLEPIAQVGPILVFDVSEETAARLKDSP